MTQYPNYSDAARVQEGLAKKVVASDAFGSIRNVCGVDVAYSADVAYCSAVVVDRSSGEVIESVNAQTAAKSPYAPGFLMLREADPIFHTLQRLKSGFDLLLVDGHGVLHPRRCGLACYVGLKLDKPTIGVAKSLLCGEVREDGSVALGDEILGFAISLAGRKKLYVSVGHRISLETAVSVVKELGNGDMPLALRLADVNSKMQKRGKESPSA